ncbi:MAG: DUF2142 domain-containing protein [Anaerolineales bacterium]
MFRTFFSNLLFEIRQRKENPAGQLSSIEPYLLKSRPWFLFFIIGIFLTTLIPPLQSPDEQAHLERAYLLSKGIITFKTLQGVGSGGYVDTGLIEFNRLWLDLPFNRRKKVDSSLIEIAQSLHWTRTEEFVPVFSSSSFPLIYLPGALAIWIGRKLDLSIYNTYFLVRFSTMVVSLATIAFASFLHPLNFLSIFILILPMSVFQFATFNADGVSYALSILVISLAIRFLSKEEGEQSWMIFILTACIFVLIASKWQFTPLAFLLLLLWWVKRSKKYLLVLVLVMLGLLIWVNYVLANYVDLRMVRETNVQDILLHYLSHPQNAIGIVWNTLTSERLMKFYRYSFIGALGWLDTRFHPLYYDIASFFLVAIAICTLSLNEIRKDFRLRTAFLLISLSIVMLIFLAMLINWSPFPASTIKGIQGRYFTVPLLLFSYVLSGTKPRYPFAIRTFVYLLFGIFITLSSFLMVRLLLVRYLIQ